MSNTLLHTPAQIARKALVDKGLGVEPSAASSSNWPCYYDNEPDTPDKVITVYDTQGRVDSENMVDGFIDEHYGLQFRIRATTANEAFLRADRIRTTLSQNASFYNVVVSLDASEYLIQCFSGFGPLLALGKDKPRTGRSLYTFNCLATITKLN